MRLIMAISGDQYFLGALPMPLPTRVDFEFVAQAEVVAAHADDVESLSFAQTILLPAVIGASLAQTAMSTH